MSIQHALDTEKDIHTKCVRKITEMFCDHVLQL